MLRAVVLLRFERLQTRDEHQTFVAFQASYLGGVDEVAPEYLVGLGIRALLALRLRDGGVVHRGLAYLLGDLLGVLVVLVQLADGLQDDRRRDIA